MTPAELHAWRSRLDIGQATLAARLGVHVLTVSKWERGVVPVPNWLHLALWAIEHNAPPKQPLFDAQGNETSRYREIKDRL